jgi:hypothetical protein
MLNIYNVLSSSGRTTIQDDNYDYHDVRYLTLGDANPASGNRYYVSLSGQDAGIDWQAGDRVMVEISLVAYKHQGQWHIGHSSDSLKLIEIDKVDKKKKL